MMSRMLGLYFGFSYLFELKDVTTITASVKAANVTGTIVPNTFETLCYWRSPMSVSLRKMCSIENSEKV